MIKLLLVAFVAVLAVGCKDQFRYPCQDPKNWDKDFCKPPICIADRTCPEMGLGAGKDLTINKQQSTQKGECNECKK